MLTYMWLLLAAVLEVAGDAFIRTGLKRGGVLFLLAGGAVLVAYGFFVNLTQLDFGRLMGLYIVLFFLVAQCASVVVFKERLLVPVMVGGALVVAGGLVMSFWHWT